MNLLRYIASLLRRKTTQPPRPVNYAGEPPRWQIRDGEPRPVRDTTREGGAMTTQEVTAFGSVWTVRAFMDCPPDYDAHIERDGVRLDYEGPRCSSEERAMEFAFEWLHDEAKKMKAIAKAMKGVR